MKPRQQQGQRPAHGKNAGKNAAHWSSSPALAAALLTGIPTRLAVIGPGTDAELSESEVINRLWVLGAQVEGYVSPADVDRCAKILDWHPTEATALVAASAVGGRGAVEMRRGNKPTPLTERGSEVWVIEGIRLEQFPMAHALAPSVDFREATATIEKVAVNEIQFERSKAIELEMSTHDTATHSVREVAEAAIANGATHISTRRLLERIGGSQPDALAMLALIKSEANRQGGLWELRSLVRRSMSST